MNNHPDALKPNHYRQARRLAVQFLYQMDIDKNFVFQPYLFQQFLEQNHTEGAALVDFLAGLLKHALTQIYEWDSRIQRLAKHWTLERISRIDLAILRVAIAEAHWRQGLDHPILIADAVKIADEFGSQQSPSFVHGVLDALLKDLKQAPA